MVSFPQPIPPKKLDWKLEKRPKLKKKHAKSRPEKPKSLLNRPKSVKKDCVRSTGYGKYPTKRISDQLRIEF